MRTLKPPINWYGGKARFSARLISLFPPHRTYVEPFGGAGALLFAKRPCGVEVYNDLNGALVNLYRVIRAPETFREFALKCSLTPYSRQELSECRAWLAAWDGNSDPVEAARCFFVHCRMGFGGNTTGFGYVRELIRNGIAERVSSYLSAIDGLERVHRRLRTVQIEHDTWENVLPRFDTPETLFYLDPPYILETRVGGAEYAHELTLADHKRLAEAILSLEGMVILSGYYHEAYAPLDWAGYSHVVFDVSCGSRGGGMVPNSASRTEVVWISPKVLEAKARLREVLAAGR